MFEFHTANQLVDVVHYTKLQEEIETNSDSQEIKEISIPDS